MYSMVRTGQQQPHPPGYRETAFSFLRSVCISLLLLFAHVARTQFLVQEQTLTLEFVNKASSCFLWCPFGREDTLLTRKLHSGSFPFKKGILRLSPGTCITMKFRVRGPGPNSDCDYTEEGTRLELRPTPFLNVFISNRKRAVNISFK